MYKDLSILYTQRTTQSTFHSMRTRTYKHQCSMFLSPNQTQTRITKAFATRSWR
jgi:hypothetical protein